MINIKSIIAGAFLFSTLFLNSGCETINNWFDHSSTNNVVTPTNNVVIPTNAVIVPTNDVVVISTNDIVGTVKAIGKEETVGPTGRLPTIATDSYNIPHIACDIQGQGMVYMYDKTTNGNWLSFQVKTTQWSSSGQYYNPHLEIVKNGTNHRAYYSGVGWHPGFGIGIIFRNNFNAAPVYCRWDKTMLSNGMPVGLIDFDAKLNNVVVGVCASYWRRYAFDTNDPTRLKIIEPQIGQYKDLGTGNGGEKINFRISKANFTHDYVTGGGNNEWHSCTDWSYNNSVRRSKNLGYINWSDTKNVYTGGGDDGAYPGLATDNTYPHVAYMTAYYYTTGPRGIYANIWKGDATGNGALTFSNKALLTIDVNGSSGMRRFAPQMTSAKPYGAWLIWTSNNQIKLIYIGPNVKKLSDCVVPVAIAQGTTPAITADSEGNLHVVYNNGGIKYRKITSK